VCVLLSCSRLTGLARIKNTDKNKFGLPADTFDEAVHVTITENGQIFEVQEVFAEVRRPNDFVTVTIRSDGDTLSVIVDGALRIQKCVRLGEHFSGRDVTVGFTAGTGASQDFHDVLSWTMDNVVPAANLVSSCGPRAVEVRPPSPMPVPAPPLSSAPSSMPSRRRLTFWEWIIYILRNLATILGSVGQ
jgi:hypothetical protein